jgi:hypothetical protein
VHLIFEFAFIDLNANGSLGSKQSSRPNNPRLCGLMVNDRLYMGLRRFLETHTDVSKKSPEIRPN